MGSFTTELYSRDRPVIDENAARELTRDGANAWTQECWRFDDLSLTVQPYAFAAGHRGLGGRYAAPEVAPDWVNELRWVLVVSGRDPDHAFRNWLTRLAADARGVIWNPQRSGDGALEHAGKFDPHVAAVRMLRATRPVYSRNDDRTRDLIRDDPGGDGARAALLAESTALLQRCADAPDDGALAEAYRVQTARAWTANAAANALPYGGDLDTVVASGLRLSADAVRHLYLAAPAGPAPTLDQAQAAGGAPGDATIWFSLYEAPVRGHRDALAFARLADGLDPSQLADAPTPPLPDSAAMRNELVAFWERLIELDPRLDMTKLTDELRRPRMVA